MMTDTMLFRMTSNTMCHDEHVGYDWFERDFNPNRTPATERRANARMVAQLACAAFLEAGLDSFPNGAIEWDALCW